MKRWMLAVVAVLPLMGMAERSVQVLDGDWQFYRGSQKGAEAASFDASSWETVSIPHTWNTDIIKNQTNADHYQGDGWYRLKLPDLREAKGRRLFLRFEGALAETDVFLNGKAAGNHQGGYTAFCFEITDLVQYQDENLLAVKVNNADNPSIIPDGSRLFARFGGLYRPVSLIITETICISPLDYASPGVYIRSTGVSENAADIDVTAVIYSSEKVNGALALQTTITDAEGQVVEQTQRALNAVVGKAFSALEKVRLQKPHLWNGREDPYLYEIKVDLYLMDTLIDSVTQKFGVRSFEVSPEQGVLLNGEPYRMYGVCRHQDWEHEGSALTDEHHLHDVEEMVEIGATTVRLAHYPQSKTMYDLCDEQGLIVWAEIPVVQGVNPKKPATFANAKQQLIEMIRQNYNHPSIFFWGLYNECWIKSEQVEELHNLAKTEDPGRLTTAATHQKELAERHRKTDLICWNKYPKWYGGFDLEAWADQQHADVPDLRFGISEYGAGGCIDQHEIPPPRPNPTKGRFFPEEYMNLVHEEVWPMLDERPYLWRTYLWNMFDFGWPGVTRGSRINLNNKGLISYDRQTRKDPFYYYKANWTDDPVLYITSRRFTDRTKAATPVKVYSNCDDLELAVNGKTVGAPVSEGYGVHVWPEVVLQKGPNTVTVKAVKDGRSFNDECVWNLSTGSRAPVAKKKPPVDNSVYVSSVSASSEQAGKSHGASKAIDGKADTFWCASHGRLPQWIRLDLLQSSDIGGVRIDWGKDAAYSYEVQVSDDGKKWTTVVEATGTGKRCLHKFKATTYFVRILCTGTPKGRWACIREVQVLAE